MLLLTVTEFRNNIGKYLQMALTERIALKSKGGIIELTPSTEIRTINPSPSGDTFWDNPQNLAQLNKDIEESKSIDITKLKSYTSIEEMKKDLGL